MLSDYQQLLLELEGVKREHAEALHHSDTLGSLSDLISDLRYEMDCEVERRQEEIKMPPEYLSVWNHRQLGIKNERA